MEAVVALGNPDKGDDGIGFYVLKKLRERKSKKLLLDAEVPENVLHKLRGKKIERLYILDAGDFSGKPGEIRITRDPPDAFSVSTHSTNLKTYVNYLKNSLGIRQIILILVQVKTRDAISPEVRKAGNILARILS
ncbi:MAG: hypothetical protein DRP12_00360 [Candidatus Aenigmatarchaeota archaeon]|nr:MAG: hypothetical protein DRP12_00360 [Candidatus Aenigmarchaeota archaeon]